MSEIKDRISGLIQKITDEEELPLRRREFSLDTVNSVLRYGAIIGSTLEHHKQVPRGMDWARQRIHLAEEANRSFPSGTVILADAMLQSRGRFKRPWHAPQGGLWMTLVLVNTLLPESNLLVPMAAGVASCETLLHYGITARLKWVNDVLAGGKKISGILTETFTGSRFAEEYVLIGIGINVNNDKFPAEFSELATSLKSSLGKEISLTEMTARLLVKLRWNIGLLYYEEERHLEKLGGIGKRHETRAENRHEDGHLLLDRYKALTDVFGRRILFGYDVREDPLFKAKVAGLDSSGGLILELDDGSKIIQHSGEIIYLD